MREGPNQRRMTWNPKMTEEDDWYVELRDGEPAEFAKALSQDERNEFGLTWNVQAHSGQLPPPGDWSVWLILAGRGFGKTRAGAEWVRRIAETDPDARIALVGANLAEARRIMVEGQSGILACSPPDRMPVIEPSLHRLTWPWGAQASLYSAFEPESLRGPQHSHACRPGAEGILRQRGLCPVRRNSALRYRRGSHRPARCAV